MTAELLHVLAPLPKADRIVLVTALQGLATAEDRALEMLEAAREDTDGDVAAEAMFGWSETLVARGTLSDADVETMAEALHVVGPDFGARRAAAVIALAIAGRLDRFAQATEGEGKPLRLSSLGSWRADDRFLQRILRQWPNFASVLGGDEAAIGRLGMSVETILPMLSTGTTNAEYFFGIFRDRMATSPHLSTHLQIGTLATFAPRSVDLRAMVRTHLILPEHHEYWGSLVAGEVFADQFADDAELRGEVIEAFSRQPAGIAATAAIAELMVRNPDADIKRMLNEGTRALAYDAATHFKLVAALLTPDAVIDALQQLLAHLPVDLDRLNLPRWVPTLVRRVERDAELRASFREALAIRRRLYRYLSEWARSMLAPSNTWRHD